MKKELMMIGGVVLLFVAALAYVLISGKFPPFTLQDGASKTATVLRELPSGTESFDVPEGAHVITLTDVGFSPNEITIKKGDAIAFRSEGEDLFWPASNLHPSHLVYPEFDPQEPIPADVVWTLVFEKPGSWRFHDHLAPYFTGTITVTE